MGKRKRKRAASDSDEDYRNPKAEIEAYCTASKQVCRRIWTSYGIFMQFIPYIHGLGQIRI